MASPKSIPSKVSAGAATYETVSPVQGRKTYLYITSILVAGSDLTVTIDGDDTTWSTAVVNLSSPIKCTSFITATTAQVAYYEQ